ncbi:SPOR domain-containing protein [Thermodesulfobacteriota bacterium]
MKKTTEKKAAAKSRKKYLLQLTGKGFFLGLCLLFLISGWMFVLGVLVGRGTAPVNFDIQALQKELLALKESMVKQEKRAMETDSAKTGAKSSFEFYEALKKKGKDEQIQIIEKKASPQAAPKTPSGAPPPSPLTSQKLVSKSKGAQEETKTLPGLPGVKPSPSGTLAVQVASTKDAASAEALVKKLAQLGYAGFSTKAEIPNKGTWYRVRVGSYRTKAEAEQMRQELTKDTFKGIIVKN